MLDPASPAHLQLVAAVQRRLERLPARPDVDQDQLILWAFRIVDQLGQNALYDADGRFTPFEPRAEARRTLEKLRKVLRQVGPRADFLLCLAMLGKHDAGVSRDGLIVAVDAALGRLSSYRRWTPRDTGLARGVAEETARTFYVLTGQLPSTTDGNDERHCIDRIPYLALVRDVFELTGLSGKGSRRWAKPAREGARRVHRLVKDGKLRPGG